MSSQPSSERDPGAQAKLWAEETRLVKECLRGEENAWSELLSKYKNLIFSIPIKYGFTQEEASDVFQSVCLDLFNELVTLREPRALAGWLIRITHNTCFHFMKDKRHYREQEEDQPDP